MPVYKLNGETYDIPQGVVESFEKDNPSAKLTYYDGDDEYEIPVSEKAGFLKQFPHATTEKKPTVQVENGNTFTAEQLDSVDNGAKPVAAPQQPYQPTDNELAGFRGTVNSVGRQVSGLNEGIDVLDKSFKGRMQNMGKLPKFGQSRNVVNTGPRYNPETNEFEDTYLTTSGQEFTNEGMAQMEQGRIDKAERDERYEKEHPVEVLDSKIAALKQKRDEAYAAALEKARAANAPKGNIEKAIHDFFTPNNDKIGIGHDRSMDIAKNDSDVRALDVALKDLEDARTMMLRSRELKKSSDTFGGIGFPGTKDFFNNWKNFGYGVWDAADDVAFNFFGNRDIDKAQAYLRVKDKMERGEELTDVETDMALAGMALAYAEQNTDLPTAYTAGKITAEMAPFMLQMAANPASGMGKSFARQAVRKFGRDGVKAVTARVAARVAGGVAESAILSNTMQAGSTAGNIVNRYTGQFGYDKDGNIILGHYEEGEDGEPVFVEGGESLGRSVYEGEASSIIENFTELGFGGSVSGMLKKAAGTKAGQKLGMSYISDLVSRVGSTPFARSMKRFQDATHWDGMIEEPLEEEYGIILNSILTGDNKISDLWDSKTQADIFAGTMWFGGMMSAMNTAAYPFARRQMKKNLAIADQEGTRAFGDEWEVMKSSIDFMEDNKIGDFLYGLKSDDNFTNEQKAALFGYAARLKQYQGANVADMLMRMEGNLNEDESLLHNAYEAGAETDEPDEMKSIVSDLNASAQRLSEEGEQFSLMVQTQQDNPVNLLDYLLSKRDTFTDSQIAAAADYLQQRARANGVMDAANDRIDLEVEKANADVRSKTHQQTGLVITAQSGNEEFFVIGGDVIPDDNGGMSLAGTGGAIVLKNAQTGEVQVKSPEEVEINTVQNAGDLINYNETTLRDQLTQQTDDQFTYGSPANEVFEMDDLVVLDDGNGGLIRGTIVGMPVSIDGTYAVQTEDNRVLLMSADELNLKITLHNGEVVKVPSQPVGTVEDVSEQEQPIQEEQNSNNEGIQEGNREPETSEPPVSALSRIPVKTDAQGQPVMNRKGQPVLDWHKASVEDAANALVETTQGDMLMARDTATDLVNNAKVGLEKIRKMKPKGADPIEIAESRMEIKQMEEEQQAIIKQWQDVGNTIRNRMEREAAEHLAAVEAAKSEEQRAREAEEKRLQRERQEEAARERARIKREEELANWSKPYQPLVSAKREMASDRDAFDILNDTEPRGLDEWVSSLLRPQSLMWNDEDRGGRTVAGLKSELGLEWSDMQRFGALIGGKGKGKPFGEVVHEIWENLPEGLKEQNTDQDVRNVLLDLFNEGDSKRMRNLAAEHRIEEARELMNENMRREAEAEMDAWAETYHLTPEERETFEDFMAQAPMIPEQEYIDQIIADNEQNRTSQEVDSQPDDRGAGIEIEGGESQVRQTAETAGNGANEETTSQSSEAQAGEPTVVDNDVPGTEQDRESLVVFFDQIGANPILAKRMSDFEVDQLTAMVEDWEIVNDEYGQVVEQTKKVLSRNRKPNKVVDKEYDDAKAKVDAAQQKSNEAFETIEDYVSKLNIKYGIDSDEPYEGPNPMLEIDGARAHAIHEAMVEAYRSGDHSAITKAAKEIQKYVDEGLEFGDEVSDSAIDFAEIYDGNDPIMLTDEYIVRVCWDRFLDYDEDPEYIRTGLKPSMRQKKNSALDNTTDTDKTSDRGKRNDTATPQSTVSEDKGTGKSDTSQVNGEKTTQKGAKISSFEELVEDSEITVTDSGMKRALRKIVDKVYKHGSVNNRTDTRGFDYSFVYLTDITNKSDRGLLTPWYSQKRVEYNDNNPTASWVDEEEQRIYFIKYNPKGSVWDWDFIIAGYKELPKTQPIGTTSTAQEIQAEEAKVDTNPSEAQKEAGNYQKGHIKIDGFDVTIENPKGSIRRGTDANGKQWEQEMHNTYGYIRGTESVDGDHIDVFLSDNPSSGKVWVIDQINKDGSFDEHKVMYGFTNAMEATQAYLSNYEDGWQGLGAISGISREEFKKWIESSHRKTKPFRDYAMAKSAEKPETPKETPKKSEPKRLVSDDRMEELKKRLRSKLGGQLNVGVDPEVLAIGAEMAVGYIERGVTKFADYAKTMIEEVGDFMRPYLKSFYNAVRDMPEAQEYASQMDDYQTVSSFDVFNFDKQKKPTIIEKAEQVVKENKVKQQTRKIKQEQPSLFGDLFAEQAPEPKQKEELGNRIANVGDVFIGYEGSINKIVDVEEKGGTRKYTYEVFKDKTDFNTNTVFTRSQVREQDLEEVLSNGEWKKRQEPVKSKQPKLRPATEADLEKAFPVVYLNGHPWSVVAVMHSGEQISATQFSKPHVDSVMLTNGKSVKLEDLMVEDENAGNELSETQSNQEPAYKAYITPEAKERYAKDPRFSNWVHPELAFITAAAWDGVNIPLDVLKQEPAIVAAEARRKVNESNGKLQLTDENKQYYAKKLMDEGSAVYNEKGKMSGYTGEVLREKKAFIVVGRPAAGKSKVFADPTSNQYKARIVDSDTVKPWLDGYDNGFGSGYVQDASAEVAELAMQMSIERGDNIVLPRVGGMSVIRQAIDLRKKGYTVELLYNEVPEESSVMRAASRFAETGRYLSLDYLTSIGDKVTKIFGIFVDKKIGDYERIKDDAQNLLRSTGMVFGREGFARKGLRELRTLIGGGKEEAGRTLQEMVGDGRLQTSTDGLDLEPIFTHAEWKSNEVPVGAKPKTIWDSNNSTFDVFLSDNELHSIQRKSSGSRSQTEEGQRTGQENRGTDSTGDRRNPRQHANQGLGSTVSVESQSNIEQTHQPAQPKQAPKHNNKRNNFGERGKDYAPTSPKARFNANVDAIKMMRELIDQGVEAPTKDQMEVLRQYSGWGGMGTFFNDESSAENKILRDLLDDEEYNAATLSIKTAYYTPAYIIDGLWDIAKGMGFKGGNMLEGSAGIGNIIAQMPRDLSRQSDIEAVEIDKISGNILKLLYPDAKVHIQGFQDTVIRNGSVDLAITNVPFAADLSVIDKTDKDLSRRFRTLHDFCIAKNIRKLREGGIGIFITSSGTLDKSTDLRAWITDEGQTDVVGAFRLNNETFGGTKVTSDIIVVRKRVGGVKSSAAIDISQANPLRVGTYEDKYGEEHQTTMVVNDYFKDHPEMMAGEMAFAYEKGDTYRPGSYGLYPSEGKNQEKMMAQFVKSMSGKEEAAVTQQQTQPVSEANQLTAVKEGRMLIDDKGRICVSRYGVAQPLGLNDQKVKGQTKQQCFKDYQAVQAAVDNVLQQQLNDPDDSKLEPKLKELNKAYDLFVKRYGTLHKNTSISFLRNDIDFPSFQALEIYKEEKDINGKVKVTTSKPKLFSERVIGFKTEPQPKTVKDAVISSIFRTNTIDVSWIAEKLGKSEENVREEILDSRLGFEDPSTGSLEVRYKYLSGNVREKLAIAEQYNKEGDTAGMYAANVEELKKVVPMDIPAHLIDFSLGSSWIPVEVYKDFIGQTFDLQNITLTHIGGMWSFDEGYSYKNEKNRAAGVYSEKFRETIYGHELLVAALNNRPVKVAKQVRVGYGADATTKTEVDQAATQACSVRIDEIKDEFKTWAKKKMQEDSELGQRIEKIYNDKFNALVPMEVGDEFLPEVFDGANQTLHLYNHQKRGVMRGIVSPTMLAHEVGTGKSFTLISTAMEMRRLGTAKKPMIVVQNATVAQMTSDAKLLYPNAKVLSLSEQDRDAEGRRAFYAKIKFNDWDIIIVPQSTFERIPDSPERELQFIQEKIDEKKHVIEAAQEAGVNNRELEKLKRELASIEQEYGDKYLESDPANGSTAPKRKKKDAKREAASLDKAETRAKEQLDRATDDVQFFDDLGVDALLVDEAHEYKHLGFQTSIGRGIKGIDPSYSKKCAGLYNKTRSVFEKAGWKNVVFATGTPISNTAAEIWTFMKYLMPADMMRANDIYYFDDFVHNFGNISQMLEFATSGKFKENTRFAAYVNKPELIRIWSQVADTVLTKEVDKVQDKIPEEEGGKDQDVFLPQSPSLVRIMTAVRAELERFENMTGQQKKENSSIPLTMYGIAKRAAIDPRLVDAEAPDEPMSKTNAAVKEIVKDLEATKQYRGTVAVFCDNQNRLGESSTGKKVVDFNIYDDMKAKLIKAGIPEKQIAIIKSGMSITAKQKVFDAVNSGDIRVVLGSTQTLGTGVNMQERLHLLIHMDAPDRPMDYTQRNGRIKRQGNLHKQWGKTIRVVRFGVEDSLDVTAYQRLKTKSGFIDSIMDGKAALVNNQIDRTVEEEEEGLFDNPVAVLSGSQYALKKNQAERELRKYQGKKAQWEADQIYVVSQLRKNKDLTDRYNDRIREEKQRLSRVKSMFPDGTVKTITVEGVSIDMTKDSGAKKLGETLKEKINDPVNAIVKRNRENAIYNDEVLNFTIGLNGHNVDFKVSVERESVWDNGKMKTVIHKFTSYRFNELGIAAEQSSRGVRDYLDELLEQVVTGQDNQDRIDSMNQEIERIKSETEQIQKRVGMPFQFDKELEEAYKHVEEYTELMKKEMAEKEAKYAEQQKEANEEGGFNLRKAEDTEDDEERFSLADAWEEPVFYSNAEMAVESIRQEKATPEQWLAMIQKNGGLKAGEDKWLGLSDWLNNNDKGSLTKQEVLDFIHQNQIEVQDVNYYDETKTQLAAVDEKIPGFAEAFDIEEALDGGYDVVIKDEAKAIELYNNDPYNEYDKIEVGKEPLSNDDKWSLNDWAVVKIDNTPAISDNIKMIERTRLRYTTDGLKNKREIALTVPDIEPYNQYDEIHFGDAGGGRAVAWVRFGEISMNDNGVVYDNHDSFILAMQRKYGAEGPALREKMTDEEKRQEDDLLAGVKPNTTKTRVLVIDEIQSKRHQDGREKGYREKVALQPATLSDLEIDRSGDLVAVKYKGINDPFMFTHDQSDNDILSRINDMIANGRIEEHLPGVPDAPFEKNWHELAMKRMLRYAAENGYDKIAWTTGNQQADRYDIGDKIKDVSVSVASDPMTGKPLEGKYDVFPHNHNNSTIMVDGAAGLMSRDQILKVYGKDFGQRMIDAADKAGVDGDVLSGDDFRIGGEGMKGFYDDMLPRFMNKYAKKWGVQVGETNLPDGTSMWSIDVTPEMKESVMQGQPMFRDSEVFEEGQRIPIQETKSQSSYNVLGNRTSYSTELMPDSYNSQQQLLDALRRQYPAYYAHIDNDTVVMESWAHVLSASAASTQRKSQGSKNYAQRKQRNAINAVHGLARQMGLDVEVITTTEGLDRKHARAKGWFNPKTGKITLVLPNNTNQSDLINTLLHEGVAHFGLRKMFGTNFNTFLDNVYNNVSPEIKARIDAAMKRNKWGRHEATEEYLARLAERTDFDHAMQQGWWQKIKEFFFDMLSKAGLMMDEPLTDNELRYILWRSYDNLLHPDSRRTIFDKAREVVMQSQLRVGRYSERERQRLQRTGRIDTSRVVADGVNEEMLNRDLESIPSQDLLLSLSQKNGEELNETVNELIRRIRTGEASVVRMGQEVQLDRGNDAQIAGTIFGGLWQQRLSELADEALGSMVQGASTLEGGSVSPKQDSTTNSQLALISWAKATGHYYSERDVKEQSLDKDIWQEAAESRVYRSADGKKVIKFTETFAYYDNPLLKRIDSITLHNQVGFEPLKVLGFSIDDLGHLQTVVEQDFVDGQTIDEVFDEEPLIKQHDFLDLFMEERLGLTRHIDEDGNLYHTKDGIIYKDIHGGNVIKDWSGRLHVIDAYVSREGDDTKERKGSFTIEDKDKELFSIRTKEPPKKTGIGYKVFVLKDGQLYPPMVANPNGEGTPVGVWLDADAAPVAGQSKTGRPQVKAGGKGTQGGSGQLAYRPGWHLGEIPYALQFNRKGETGERTLFPNNFVWAEVEYADDVDYQDEARQEGVNANGKYQHSLAGLKHVPTDGSYRYRTNPDPRTDEWIITGAMRVNRILTRSEVDEMVRKAGREPQPVQDGDTVTDEAVKELNEEIQAMREADEMGLLYRDDSAWEDDIASDVYEKAVASDVMKWQEAWQDSMISLKAIQDAIAAETGNEAKGAEDAYQFENRMHGRAKNMSEQYDWKYFRPMLKEFYNFINGRHMTFEQGVDYLIAKSGLERNDYYAFRDALREKIADDVAEDRKELDRKHSSNRISDDEYDYQKQLLDDKEQNGVDDAIQQLRSTLAYQRAREDYRNGDIDYSEYLRRIEELMRGHSQRRRAKRDGDGNIVSTNYFDDHVQDYSGLTETLNKDAFDAAQQVKKAAQRAIDQDERRWLWRRYDTMMREAYTVAREVAEDAVYSSESVESTNDLWDSINDATKETLKQSYEMGLIDKPGYTKVKDMFDFYIPLRGWEEDKASDVYTYMGKDNVFSPAVKKTWGRRSKAENPLAYIGNIAVSTILSGHRNLMKQHFLNYVMNNPTSLVSISESWYENIGDVDGRPVWVLRSADTAGKSADEVAQIVADFNEEMRLKQADGKAMPVKGRLRLDVNATKGQKAEHVVEVQRGGHNYQLYINGNPKAAQALNGTAVKAVSRINNTFIGKVLTKLNRAMATFFTSKNPAFVISNMSRDLNMAGASVLVNESPEYNARFIANVAKVLRPRIGKSSKWVPSSQQPTGLMPSLMRKWRTGTLDNSDETERLFNEFMSEGGETGFVNMLSIDSFKEDIKKRISQMNGSNLFGRGEVKEMAAVKGLRLLGDIFEFYNRCAEDSTRFIVYMTSRQMGKTLEDSIADAKNVTLNFNRKGTGALGNADIRDLFIFVNPAIQALANMMSMAKKHPVKFGGVVTGFIAGGVMIPVLNQWLLNMFGGDDDKEAYWNLPPWVRKNNLVLWIPFTKNFLTIPLAQEFRVFYGVGEMMASSVMKHPVHNQGLEIVASVADLIPINPTGNGGNLMVDFAPTAVQPLMQVGENIDFTGKPIWRDNQGNKHAPMYTKAYVSTPKWMVKISEVLNMATGGNEGKKGAIERYMPFWGEYINNPAVWNHLMQGYYGGMYNTIAKTFDVVTTAAGGEMPKVYQTPVVNRFLNRPVERDNAGALGEEYYSQTEDRDILMYELKTWKKKAADGDADAQARVDEIMSSDDYKRAEVVSHYEKIMRDLKAGERAATEKEDKQLIKESISMYKKQMMDELNAIDNGKDPLDAAVEQFGNAETIAEKNKLRLRIERLTSRKEKNADSSQADVKKALSYSDDELSDDAGNNRYLQLATPENIRDDARIKAAKAEIRAITGKYRKMMDEGRTEEAGMYRIKNQKYFVAEGQLNQLSRSFASNKKMLGQGWDSQLIKLMDQSRSTMLKVIDNM